MFTNKIDYLDRIWHQFILNTKFYIEFCNSEFGEYLHHVPDVQEQYHKSASETAESDIFVRQMVLLEDNLGADFVNRVYFIYPELLRMES